MLLKLADLFSFFSVVLRAGTLVFQSTFLGGVLFTLWITQGSAEQSGAGIGRIQTSVLRLLRICATGLALMQVLYLYVNAAVLMATAEISFFQVIGAQFFISGFIVLIAATGTAIVATPKSGIPKWVLPALATIIVSASVMTNHAVSRLDGRSLLVTLACIHELAVGFWIGGLPFLILVFCHAEDISTKWYVTERFSRVAMASVSALVLSGLVMSILYIGSWSAVFGTAYGVMVVAKAAMLCPLLLLGGVNFFMIRNTPANKALPRLRRLVEAEVGIGITVILAAASLTSQPPAIDQASSTVTLAQIAKRLKPVLPRLTYRNVAAAATADAEFQSASAPARQMWAYDLDGVPLTRQMINDAIESESNHHWMGLVVLMMGLLALLSRTGKASWAGYWPLLLIGVALFIFLQADTECWPVGWKGFAACWADPEVFQHRVAAILCALFAGFEARRHGTKKGDDLLALVFPTMCAVGGAVLLTHSHAISNVKQNLLLELNHVPMGVTAVFAGWARWLELRLPEKDRPIPSWIWPACFVLIGLMLLNYREM